MLVSRIFYGLSLLFFWLMLVIPTTYQVERGILLGLLLIVAIIHSIQKKKWKLNYITALIGGMCVLASIIFMFNGVINDSPGAIKMASVYVLWPLLFLFTMGIFHTPEHWNPFLKALIVGGIFAALIGILAVAEGLGFFYFGLIDFLGDDTRIGIAEDTIAFSMPNIATVIFILPFSLAFLLLPRELTSLNRTWRVYIWVSFLLSLVVLVISGRRAFWLSAAISPFSIIFISILCNVKISLKKISMIAIAIALLTMGTILFLDIKIEAIWDDFISGFDFSDSSNLSSFTRNQQFLALLHGWMESPVLGAGLGSSAPGFIRSADTPWAYELSYMSLLFNTGIIGILVYGGAVLWLFIKSASIVRRRPNAAGMLIPLLSGLVCFLIVNASNPYLGKFDYLWTLFFPVAVLNAYLLRK